MPTIKKHTEITSFNDIFVLFKNQYQLLMNKTKPILIFAYLLALYSIFSNSKKNNYTVTLTTINSIEKNVLGSFKFIANKVDDRFNIVNKVTVSG